MRILLIEDEKNLATVISKGLEEEGYSVDVSTDGEEGLFMAQEIPHDVIILDIMLPGLDGFSILQSLRSSNILTPVIMLTAKDALEDKIKGLDTGADDYLTKPFEFEELLARLRALLRRKSTHKSAVLKIHDLEINTSTKEVRRSGTEIHLTAKEYALLEYLAYNKNTVLSRTEIIEHIYDHSYDFDSNVIDVFINNLRKKIDRNYSPKLIHTVRGAGYILRE